MTTRRKAGVLTAGEAEQERGAVAVEFALLLPVLLLILFGIIDFGRAFNAQITLTQAAREGVRVYAITGNAGEGDARAQEAVQGTALQSVGISTTTTGCTAGDPTTLTATYQFSPATPLIPAFTLTSKATARCNG